MSSTLRKIAQIPARIKYLVAIDNADSTTNVVTSVSCYGIQFADPADIPSESLVAYPSGGAFTDSTEVNLAQGDLFKDLGRQLVIYDSATDAHLAVFRQVQLVNGAGSEGVGATLPATFIKVWSASGGGVGVARTGPGAH